MRSILFIFTLLSVSQSCKNGPSPGKQNAGSENNGATYLALGDSYTIGESVSESERWPVILADALRKMGKPTRSPHIIAVTGWTTRDLLSGLQNYTPDKPFDMVSLLIGVNNQFQGRHIDEFRAEFRELLLKSVRYAGDKKENVFVLSIPDWGVTPYGEGKRERIALDIDRFNAVVKEECEKEQIVFVNITPISRQALNDPTMLARDQLHFSGKMHQLWVNETLKKIRSKN